MSEAIEVKVGEQVPDFTLPGSNGRPVTLSEFRGKKVVLYFYPQDLTPSCTDEACSFRDRSAELAAAGAEIIGISTDDVAKHLKFIAKYELPFLLLADVEHQVCELFGVWQTKKMYGREYMGLVRSTFLIDEQGILLQEWRNVKVKGHVEAVLQAI
jgi:peroxiredoxin Q/BCP